MAFNARMGACMLLLVLWPSGGVAQVGDGPPGTSSGLDFDNFDDNIAMESFTSLNFADFLPPSARRKSAGAAAAGDTRSVWTDFIPGAEDFLTGGGGFGERLGANRDAVLEKKMMRVDGNAGQTRDGTERARSGSKEQNALNQLLAVGGKEIGKLLAGDKDVGEVKEELSTMLFGNADLELDKQTTGQIGDEVLREPANFMPNNVTVVDGDRAEYLDYDQEEYDLYAYDEDLLEDNLEAGSMLVDAIADNNGDATREEIVDAAQLRQIRPGRPGTGLRPQPRPFRRRFRRPSGAMNPGIHRVPGRIQGQSLPRGRPMADPSRDSQFGESISTGHVAKKKFFTSGGPLGGHASRSPGQPQCKLYTDSLCLEVSNYPTREIVALLGADRRVSLDMIADVSGQSADDLIDGVSSNQEVTYTLAHYYGDNRRDDVVIGDNLQHRDFAQEGGFLCPSEIKYAKPKRGKTAQGVWKDIVNVNDYTQTLRMEKCLHPGGSCSYVSHHYKSQCSQVYNYHRLLSWDKERGLHMDIYKVPTCCSCHIMGYSYIYPPLSKSGAPQTPAVSRPASSSQPRPTFSKPASSASNPLRPIVDNLIPDFNPQEELEQFMQTIGNDLKDFNTFGSGGGGGGGRPPRAGNTFSTGQKVSQQGFRPTVHRPFNRGGQQDLVRRRLSGQGGDHLRAASYPNAVRRADGFAAGGDQQIEPVQDQPRVPRHKYETIPLGDKQEADRDEERNEEDDQVVNYGYHPIIDFFTHK